MFSDKWISRFLSAADFFSSWSRDTSLKVGAIIVDSGKEIIATGYNDLPRNVDDSIISRFHSPLKDMWTEHAERNAIYNAARKGVSTLNCTLFCTMFPCSECARGIIQSGIKCVIVKSDNLAKKDKWTTKMQESKTMLEEAGISVIIYSSPPIINTSIPPTIAPTIITDDNKISYSDNKTSHSDNNVKKRKSDD